VKRSGHEVSEGEGERKRDGGMAGSLGFAPENAVRPGRNTLFLRRIEIVCTNVILGEEDEKERKSLSRSCLQSKLCSILQQDGGIVDTHAPRLPPPPHYLRNPGYIYLEGRQEGDWRLLKVMKYVAGGALGRQLVVL
jgi:hypothetical protein